ncbi:hypothetical protein ETD86_29545 [Nonomuraea turkmeniaca]|uniref:Uncharacterized protein n=1 Tax=Nonomuraea turkmeniaca TaxID=103838 RepID=A0A5S4FAB4_9ACTN|nr:hypothetical protein [Nonomuraea turkmeniaca]TMR14092.1 hypothetical protein ETD86_29545 [Nonomuraea turkmeniaca]
MPEEEADEAAWEAWARSIHGQAEVWRKVGVADLDRQWRHVAWDMIRLVWVTASMSDVRRFLQRLEVLAGDGQESGAAVR